jgi:hypothetical protein
MTVTVRMAQQMSGRRYDGREWPPYGGTIEVSAEEAAELCHTSAGSSTPIAVPVVEARKVETADAPEDPKVEARAERAVEAKAEAAAAVSAPPPAPPVSHAPPEPVRRAPGRPPKS